MSGRTIARQVLAGIQQARRELGDAGVPKVYLLKEATETVRTNTYPFEAVVPAEPSRYELHLLSGPYSMKDRAGGLTQPGDKRLFIAASGPVPTTADKIELPEGTFDVIECEPYAPAGVPLYYIAQVRG